MNLTGVMKKINLQKPLLTRSKGSGMIIINLLVRVFLDNFTQAFQDFCTEKRTALPLSRLMAHHSFMGMMEGK
jgi:hypothetical protein